MAQRTITDAEIALIKAMLAHGMRNRDIQFYFNRPGRAVNSGRITCIANGTYSNSAAIAQASDDDLDVFKATHSPSAEMPRVFAAAKVEAHNPVSDAVLRKMFTKSEHGAWKLTAGEGDHAECKKKFHLRHPAPWLRAVAALANNQGGYVFFGKSDKDAEGTHEVTGQSIEEFMSTDIAKVSDLIRSTFDPTPSFQRAMINFGDKKVGVLYVERHPSCPVIATRAEGEGSIKEGDIFFRYPGQSARISYSDLRAMLDNRDAQARADILPMVKRLLDLGPARAMVADLLEGRLMDGKSVFEMDDDMIKQLHLIKEGEFNQLSGAPALRLIGDVKAVSIRASPTTVKKGLVLRSDMLKDFLSRSLRAGALDYVRCAIEVSGNDWLPIRYFSREAGMSTPELIDFIENDSDALPAQQALYRERLSSFDKAFKKASRPAGKMLSRVLAAESIEPKDCDEAKLIATALQGLPYPPPVDPESLRVLLAKCFDLCWSSEEKAAKSAIRKAIARLDEVLFR